MSIKPSLSLRSFLILFLVGVLQLQCDCGNARDKDSKNSNGNNSDSNKSKPDDYQARAQASIAERNRRVGQVLEDLRLNGIQSAIEQKNREKEEQRKSEEWKVLEAKIQKEIERLNALPRNATEIICFIPGYRVAAMEEIKEYFEYIVETLEEGSASAPLTGEQQADIKKLIGSINRELRELNEEIETCLKPGSNTKLQYSQEERELADQLVSQLQELKSKIAHILATKGEQLADYGFR